MDLEPKLGGACGEIIAFVPDEVEGADGKLRAPTVIEKLIGNGQYVEYKFGHYLDKAADAFFGFVQVLPGAFNTIRWEAINGRPLDEFFKTMRAHFDIDCYTANMYLAEDRIFCMEILTILKKDWYLKYIPNCTAMTDPPLDLISFMKQR